MAVCVSLNNVYAVQAPVIALYEVLQLECIPTIPKHAHVPRILHPLLSVRPICMLVLAFLGGGYYKVEAHIVLLVVPVYKLEGTRCVVVPTHHWRIDVYKPGFV
ncbi:hypothetical protein FGO68_gene16584 [Halteria grandinella]|uniref:Uncharacterized protein n=1 Tax=Halteria grandinella TaxID=5974 RepID=A0A8J8NE03_HALGN|nr:hypothetical protein FGO68_gene16584 [Halteria grandinella]